MRWNKRLLVVFNKILRSFTWHETLCNNKMLHHPWEESENFTWWHMGTERWQMKFLISKWKRMNVLRGESKTNYPREMLDSEVPVMPSWETIPSRQSTAQIKEDKAETCTLLITVRVDTQLECSHVSHTSQNWITQRKDQRGQKGSENCLWESVFIINIF